MLPALIPQNNAASESELGRRKVTEPGVTRGAGGAAEHLEA